MSTIQRDPYLTHQWVLAGIASAAARFIPVPFVDDVVRTRSRQFAIARTLSAHNYDYPSGDLAALYGGETGGFFGRTLRKIATAPLKLALFPIRKLVKIFGSVRGVPLDLMRTVLMARTLDRCIERGMFAPSMSESERSEQADQVRIAFEEAFDGIDWVTVRSLMSDTMLQVRHWSGVTTDLAEKIFAKDKSEPEALSVTEMSEEPKVAAGAEEVEAMLQRPETMQLMEKFDERFDEALA